MERYLGACLPLERVTGVRIARLRQRLKEIKSESRRGIHPAQHGIWKIVADDFAKTGAAFRHGFCAALAKADSVTLARSFKKDLGIFHTRCEIIAGHRVPAQTPVDGESSRFTLTG